jgi:hypothetical protein
VATVRTVGSPLWWAIGLAGFLARGGILLLATPIVVLPSVVGLTTFIGPNAVTAAGFSPRFVALLAATVVIAGTWVVLGTLVGCAVDRFLVPAVLGLDHPGPSTDAGREPGLAPLFAIRSACLLPVAAGMAAGAVRLGQVGYQELILPSDSVTPFVARVLLGAPDAVAVIGIGLLAGELLGAVAVRLAIVERRTVPGALVGAGSWLVRHPIRSTAVTVTTILGSLVLVGPPVIATVLVWGGVRESLLGSADPVASLIVIPFVTAWAIALGLAGIAAAWRSAAWSLVMMGDHRGGGPDRQAGGTL